MGDQIATAELQGPEFGSPEYVEYVKSELARLRELQRLHGERKGLVMWITGLSATQVDELGGVPDE